MLRKLIAGLIVILILLTSVSCASGNGSGGPSDGGTAEKNGEIYIIFTSDVHCAVSEGFGYAGLYQIRTELEKKGYTTILVDDGDSVQGDSLGTLSKGETIIELMNAAGYDAAIPGNHEFDYGMDQFLKLVEMAEFPYISCNFNKEGELVFAPYTILEAEGIRIAFIGVTTPETVTSSTPRYFQDEDGNFIYGFMQGDGGNELYSAVQQAVDSARAEGADYVYLMGHLGMIAECEPWTYADVISNTRGIDVVFDGHSHDSEFVVMKNADGDDVVRACSGTKLNCIGYSHIAPESGIVEAGTWNWPNTCSAEMLFGLVNELSVKVDEKMKELDVLLDKVVATTVVDLTINDPQVTDQSGNPIRMVRRAETNLGDLCTDALRIAAGADIAVMNGGGIRKDIPKGDITYGDIIGVFPFGNYMCVVEATGQQIMDALEWGARAIPGENGGFLHISGGSYEVDASIPDPCIEDENGMMTGIDGRRRVGNVMIGGEAVDPERLYTVAGIDYVLLENGGGLTAFDGCRLIQDRVKLDNQLLIEYITESLGGEVGMEYADPYGAGRIVIMDTGE